MNLFRVAWKFARYHRVATLGTILSLALATSLLLLVLHVQADLSRNGAAPKPIPRDLADLLVAYGSALVLLAMGTIACTLSLTTMARRRDHAILRSLGAQPRDVFAVVIGEAMIQVTLGALLGLLMSRLILGSIQASLSARYDIQTKIVHFHPAEIGALLAVLFLGILAALAPAWRAYRTDVISHLRR